MKSHSVTSIAGKISRDISHTGISSKNSSLVNWLSARKNEQIKKKKRSINWTNSNILPKWDLGIFKIGIEIKMSKTTNGQECQFDFKITMNVSIPEYITRWHPTASKPCFQNFKTV